MGYAKLKFNYDGTTQVGNVVRDIVAVVSGDTTSTSQLFAADPSLSEIVNSSGRGNWTKLYPNTTSGSIPQVLSASCVNNTTKYIQIGGCGASLAINTTTNTTAYALATAGVYTRGANGASSATALTGNSIHHSGGTSSTINTIIGPYVYLSWSSRHLLIMGETLGGNTGYVGATGVMEFTESSIYDARNVAPFCTVQYFNYDSGLNLSVNRSSTVIHNHYIPLTGVANGAYPLSHYTEPSQGFLDTSTLTWTYNSRYNNMLKANNFTRTASGSIAAQIQPLFWHQTNLGIPYHYVSDLCKVYKTQKGIGRAGDTMTIGNDTYVYFPIFDAGGVDAYNLALLVQKA